MIPAPKTLLLGTSGSGKSTALKTLLNIPDVEILCIITEPMGLEVLSDTDPSRFHWMYLPCASPSFASLSATADIINKTSFEGLTQMKSGIAKQEYNQIVKIIEGMVHFKCDRCKKDFGPADVWDNKKILVHDSLSGLSIAAIDNMVGSKPIKAIGEWGAAMDFLERLINKCCSLNCGYILTSHLEKELDEVSSAMRVMASTLGKKLAPKLPRFFSDVILTKKDEKGWYWTTTDISTDLKTRNLEYNPRLSPDFSPLYKAWAARNAKSEPVG